MAERVIAVKAVAKKPLPKDLLGAGEEWHAATVRWWRRWKDSPLTDCWTEVDWSELEACALLHQEFMKRRTFTLAAELRLRMASFGATPADRARLRIVLADADEREAKCPESSPPARTARSRRGSLRALPSPVAESG